MRKQVFQAEIYVWLLCLLLVSGCRAQEPPTVWPTPIGAAAATLLPATPTLIPTPTPLPSPTPDTRSLGDPYIPELGNLGYDVQRYTLQLALDPDVVWVRGTAVLEAITTTPLSELSLDFVGFTVTGVWWETTPASFTRSDAKLIITLPEQAPAALPFRLTIAYEGAPPPTTSPHATFADSLGFVFGGQQTVYTLAEPDGAHAWFPCNNHPRDKALFRFEVTTPLPYTAVANGQLRATLPADAGQQTFIWEHNYPMATYLALVAVGVYERLDDVSPGGIPLRHYIFPEARAEFEPVAATTAVAIDWMSDLFGPYPFEAFGLVMVDGLSLAMETQTMVLVSPELLGKKTAVHELAHMWFGNWVSLDSWSEMWRKEGLATYIELLWRFRGDAAGLEAEMANITSGITTNSRQFSLAAPPPAYLFDYNIYYKGAALLHALRQEMGDEAFFAGLRVYVQSYGGRAASDAQFQAVMEAAVGRSLAPFFAQWLG